MHKVLSELVCYRCYFSPHPAGQAPLLSPLTDGEVRHRDVEELTEGQLVNPALNSASSSPTSPCLPLPLGRCLVLVASESTPGISNTYSGAGDSAVTNKNYCTPASPSNIL